MIWDNFLQKWFERWHTTEAISPSRLIGININLNLLWILLQYLEILSISGEGKKCSGMFTYYILHYY